MPVEVKTEDKENDRMQANRSGNIILYNIYHSFPLYVILYIFEVFNSVTISIDNRSKLKTFYVF